jgi:hypothetical protein
MNSDQLELHRCLTSRIKQLDLSILKGDRSCELDPAGLQI